jgi:preprotein translocase subunit YajC
VAPVGWPAVISNEMAIGLIANSNSGGGGSAIFSLGFLLLIPVAMYFLLIRPQRKRMRDQQQLQSSLEVCDEVITTSGVFGTITGEDGPSRFWLEIDDDVQIRISRAAIQGKAALEDEDGADEPADDSAGRAE